MTLINNFTTADIDKLSEVPGFRGRIIRNLIDEHYTLDMLKGEAYYNNEGDIKKRKLYYWEDGIKKEDETKTNNRIAHNWHKLLVDQKTAYLCGKPISFLAKDEEAEPFAELVNEILEDDFDDDAAELVKEASNKGLSFLQIYINDAGVFRYVPIPAEEVIPIWDTSRQRELIEVIRYYTMSGEVRDYVKAEWWTANDVTYFIETEKGEFVLDPEHEVNPAPHYYKNGQGFGWGRVPFICFKNNKECKNDLTFYKELVDIYDIINSDIANEFEEIQKFITIVKGYSGTDNKELLDNLRYHKLVKVDESGGLETLTSDIPIAAFNEFADRLEENIFLFGQGVNIKSDKFGNLSGVALKFMYGLLDLKSGIVERKFRTGLRDLIEFIALYLQITKGKVYDPKKINIIFNKSMLLNEAEMVQMAQQSLGVISQETIIANHPWVENPAEEKERLKESQLINLDEFENEGD